MINFNKTALKQDGFEFRDLNCCYKTVTRVEQEMTNFDKNAENLIK